MGSSPPVRPWKLQLKLESWGNGKGYFQQHFHISAAETDAIWKQLCSSVTQFKICSFSPQRLSNNRDMRIILWVINAGAACSICLAFSRKAQQQDAFVETPTSDFRNTQASGVDTNSSDLQSYGSPNPPALKWSLVKSTKSPSPSQLKAGCGCSRPSGCWRHPPQQWQKQQTFGRHDKPTQWSGRDVFSQREPTYW